jgi:RNA polymerase sigma-70 factor (sigma-E family)
MTSEGGVAVTLDVEVNDSPPHSSDGAMGADTSMVEGQIELGDRAGDVIRRVYELEFTRLVGLARLLVDRREDAEEVVQEAFVRTCANIRRVRGDDPLPYVRRAVVNLSRDRLRRLRTVRAHRDDPRPDAESAEQGAVRHASDRAVVERLATLPRRQRECVVLRFYADLSVPDIARALGIAEGSVKSHLHRAMTTLAIELEDQR